MVHDWYAKTHFENRKRPIDNARFTNTDGFIFGGVNSRDFDVFLSDINISGSPERDVSFTSVAGRNGDLIIDNNRWKNIDITYSCFIATDFSHKFDSLKARLISLTGYQRLTDSIYPNVYRQAILRSPVSPETMRYNRTGRFDVTFTCKPQRFLVSGEQVIKIIEPTVLFNTYGTTALPIVTIYGTGSGTVTIGSTIVEIKELTDKVTLDCELQHAYRQVGDAAPENKNATIRAVPFPVLGPGENVISWTGDISHIEIIPRWWTL